MSIPKIKFKELSLEDNIDFIKWTYFQNEGPLNLHKQTLECFPKLNDIDENMSNEEIYIMIEEVVIQSYNHELENIKNNVRLYNDMWSKYNDMYFNALSSYLGVEWPQDLDYIIASIGLLPVFPRHLDSYSFLLGLDLSENKVIEVCAHETLHFLWFLKWKKIHPETKREEYDSPHTPWLYSEMVTDPILNNKPFTDIFKFNEKGYDEFYTYENGKVMENLRNIYSKNISIEEKINSGYFYIKDSLNK